MVRKLLGVKILGKWIDAIKKLGEKNTPNYARVDESKKSEDEKIDVSNVKQTDDEKVQNLQITIPPNCYVDGKINAYFGSFTYEQIYKYTSQPLKIKNNGGRRVPCTKCDILRKYNAREINSSYKKMLCAECVSTYITYCNVNSLDIRGYLIKKGLERFIDDIQLGYDFEKQALIFPLNNNQYVELGFNGKEYTQSRAESLKVLMHYNRRLVLENGEFKAPYNYCYVESPLMPYLDNRFYGVDGEMVIGGRAGSIDDNGRLDNGRYLIESGKMILPFPI